ncbi:MAG: hypothetical protein V2B13_20400 [Pseudomonadota bacterium]
MELGENYFVFQISNKGKVRFLPDKSQISTSPEMKESLQEIAVKTAKFMESLLKEKSWKSK